MRTLDQSIGLCKQIFLASCLIAFSLVPSSAPAQARRPQLEQEIQAIQQRIEANDIAGARALLQGAQRTHPANGGLENLLGVVEVQEGHRERAEVAFRAAIAHQPTVVGAYLNLARLLLETQGSSEKRRTEALELYQRAVRIDPTNTEAHFQAASLLLESERYAQSLAHLDQLGATDRRRIGPLVVRCADEAALSHKDAADRAASALAQDPGLSEQDIMSALSALRMAHRADILELLLTAVEKRTPLSSGGLRILGLAEEAEGKFAESRATLERAYAARPSDVIVLSDLARIAEERKDYQGALGYLAHARDLQPSNAAFAYEFALDCLKMNLLEEARKAAAQAAQLEPENATYQYGMGMITLAERSALEALPFLLKYHRLRPEDPGGDLALGTVYYRAKDYDAATPWLKKASFNGNTAGRALLYLARIDREKGNLEVAAAELQQSSKIDPSQPDVLAEQGQIDVQRRRYAEAEEALSKALQLDPDNYAANFGLLQLYVRSSDPRRSDQSKRFDALKQRNEELSREMMRVLEIDSSASTAGGSAAPTPNPRP